MPDDDEVPHLPPDWYALPPADEFALRQLVMTVPVALPASYLAFLRRSNGGEGKVDGRYVSLWPAREVHLCNDDYGVYRYLPGVVAFGTNGGDDGYLFDGRGGDPEPPVLVVELGSLALGFDAVRLVAKSFASLLGAR